MVRHVANLKAREGRRGGKDPTRLQRGPGCAMLHETKAVDSKSRRRTEANVRPHLPRYTEEGLPTKFPETVK